MERDKAKDELFELMYGYPIQLAHQVIDMAALNTELDKEFVEYHTTNLEELERFISED